MCMKKPVIGLVPGYDPQKKQCFLRPHYARAIQKAGGLAFILPLTDDRSILEDVTDMYDGFLFTGGADLSPELYGEQPLPCTGKCIIDREKMESALLELILKKQKPILGICRGMQFLNVAFGGSLYQDLLEMRNDTHEHWQPGQYETPSHLSSLLPGTPLTKLLNQKELAVNSMHHQGIKTLAPDLLPMALSDDGLVEGIYLPDYPFLWGIQWHPEFMADTPEQLAIFQAFIQAADQFKMEPMTCKDPADQSLASFAASQTSVR